MMVKLYMGDDSIHQYLNLDIHKYYAHVGFNRNLVRSGGAAGFHRLEHVLCGRIRGDVECGVANRIILPFYSSMAIVSVTIEKKKKKKKKRGDGLFMERALSIVDVA